MTQIDNNLHNIQFLIHYFVDEIIYLLNHSDIAVNEEFELNLRQMNVNNYFEITVQTTNINE